MFCSVSNVIWKIKKPWANSHGFEVYIVALDWIYCERFNFAARKSALIRVIMRTDNTISKS